MIYENILDDNSSLSKNNVAKSGSVQMHNKPDAMKYQDEKMVEMLDYNNVVKLCHLIAMVLTSRVLEELLHSIIHYDYLYNLQSNIEFKYNFERKPPT